MDAGYIQKVQAWVQLDNKVLSMQEKLKPHQEKIKTIQEEHKEVLDKKEALEKEIVEYVSSNKMEMLTINTSDGNIKFSKRNNTQPLSMKILKNMLDAYKEDHEDIDTDGIIDYITNNLDKKTKLSIKRTLKKGS